MTQERTYEKLHFRNLLVHLLHELDYEVHQLMLKHFLCVGIRDQKRNVIALDSISLR